MDMGSSTMSMSMDPSMTMSMPATSSSAASSMGGMDDMSMMGGCKISMTWNWYTVGACFISKTWQVTSSGMFAGSCIGVICLVISLEFLRRGQREYEALLRRQDQKKATRGVLNDSERSQQTSEGGEDGNGKYTAVNVQNRAVPSGHPPTPRSVLVQRQLIRSLLHMVQFGVAYFIMLLAMYYNGYIIICILIGAFLGAFIFSWDQLLEVERKSATADITGCCG